MALLRIPSVRAMTDETMILHLEKRHDNDLRMQFMPEPGKDKPRTSAPKEWRTFHDKMHELHGDEEYKHTHNDA